LCEDFVTRKILIAIFKAEVKFIDSQNSRREAQKQLTEVQNALRLLRADIDRTARGDDRYLELIKKVIFLKTIYKLKNKKKPVLKDY